MTSVSSDPSRAFEALAIAPSLQDPSDSPTAPGSGEDGRGAQRALPSGLIHSATQLDRPLPSVPEQRAMLATLEAIFQRAEEAEGGVGVGELRSFPGEEGALEAYDGRSRVDTLTNVRGILDQMWLSDSDFMEGAAEVLADGSREPEWRLPLGEAGVLDFFLAVIATDEVANNLMIQALRLVGNCCADTPENRERVVGNNQLSPIISRLKDQSLMHVVIPVLYNICVDYGKSRQSPSIQGPTDGGREPAQQQVASSGLVSQLIDLLSSATFAEGGVRALFGYTCRLLELTVVKPGSIESSPDNAAEVLFQLASNLESELDDFLALVNAAVVHLSSPRIQQHLVAQGALKLPLAILVRSYSRPSTPEHAEFTIQSPEDEKLLTHMRNNVIKVLSDVSAIPEFKDAYPLESPLVGSLRMWLAVSQAQLQVCACVMLGNLARSDDVCRTMVHDFQVQDPLINLLRTSDDTQVLHAATSFLKNLALMPDNKNLIGEAGLIEVLSRLWSMDTAPQIQYAGASLTRQVVSGSFQNIQRLLTSLSSDPDSPAHSRTYLSLLLRLCARSDQPATHIEVARTVTAICRVLNSPNQTASPEEVEALSHRLYSLHHDVARPLVAMIKQKQWPVIRSEGWFAFALMARSKEGAPPVNEAMSNSEILRPLVEVVTGREMGTPGSAEETPPGFTGLNSPSEEQQKTAEMRRIDRENALVLISKLLEHLGDEMVEMRRQVFEDLLQGRELSYSEFGQLAQAETRQEGGPEEEAEE